MQEKLFYKISNSKRAVPLYSQIELILRNRILSGDFEPDLQLPTDDDFVRQFGVSKITIRNALANLVAEGLVVRNRGKGSFVKKKLPEMKQFIFSSIQDIIRANEKLEVKFLGMEKIKIGESRIAKKIQSFLRLPKEAEIYLIRRIRLLDKVPIIYLENFLPLEMGEKIPLEEVETRHSILKILIEKASIVIERGEMHLESIPAEADISDLLQCQTYSPMIRTQTYFWASKNCPVEAVNGFRRAEYFKYQVELNTNWIANI